MAYNEIAGYISPLLVNILGINGRALVEKKNQFKSKYI